MVRDENFHGRTSLVDFDPHCEVRGALSGAVVRPSQGARNFNLFFTFILSTRSTPSGSISSLQVIFD